MKRACIQHLLLLAGIAATLAGCGGHGNYTTEGLNAAQERMATIKSGTEWDMARQQFLAGDLSKALKSVDQSIAINENVAKSHSLRGRILMELGQLDAAVTALQKSVELNAAFVEAHYFLGIVYERFGEFDSALEEYQTAAMLEPGNAQHVIAAAEMLIESGHLDEALRMLDERKKDFEHNSGVRQALAHIALMQHRPADAARLFNEAHVLDPADLSIMEDLALAQMDAGQFAEAEYTLRVLLNDPATKGRRDLKRLQAQCLASLDRPVEARSILLGLTSDERGLNDVDAWIDLGNVALMLGDLTRVRSVAARIVSLAPTRYEGPLLMAFWKREQADLVGALRSAEQAVRMANRVNAAPAMLRGMILQDLGRFADAEASIREAIAIDPSRSHAGKILVDAAQD